MSPNTRITKWITNTLAGLSKLKNKEGLEIIHQCGAACCENDELYKAALETKKNDQSGMEPDALFNAFKKTYYDSDKFNKSGNEITLILEACTCPMVKNGVKDSYLCNCTVGYSKKLFEILFEKEVEVELDQSILRGDAICKQRITI